MTESKEFMLALNEQNTVIRSINKIIINANKKGQLNLTATYLQGRLEYLNKQWERCQKLHNVLQTEASEKQKRDLEYFNQNHFDTAEDDYDAAINFLTDKLDAIQVQQELQRSVLSSTAHEAHFSQSSIQVKLPKFELPKFNGEFEDWLNFKSLFNISVNENSQLNNIQKLQYLRASLTGEALNLIKSMPIVDENYEKAWKCLVEKYEDKKTLINTLLNKITSLSNVQSDNYNDLKNMRDECTTALNSLETLNCPVQHWDILLIHILVKKFSNSLKKDWEEEISRSREYPKMKTLNEFIDRKITILRSIKIDKQNAAQHLNKTKSKHVDAHNSGIKENKNNQLKCKVCDGNHYIYNCEKFREMTQPNRFKFIKSRNLCINCFSNNHKTNQCPSKYRCSNCKLLHNTLLHRPVKSNQNREKQNQESVGKSNSNERENNESQTSSSLNTLINTPERKSVLLATLLINIINENGQKIQARALLDQGSETSFITTNLAQLLRLKRERKECRLIGIGGIETDRIKYSTQFKIAPRNKDEPKLMMHAYVVNKITSYTRNLCNNKALWEFRNLNLADPNPLNSTKIEILIGADYFGKIILNGLRRDKNNDLIAQNTILGWVISGKVTANSHNKINVHSNTATIEQLNSTLKKFWENEEVPETSLLNNEEKMCENYFTQTVSRNNEGRYIVRLPFKSEEHKNQLGNSLNIATSALIRLENKLNKRPEVKSQYSEFLGEYKSMGHMSQIDSSQSEINRIFIPHRDVQTVGSLTHKLRVVFNASQKTSTGISLNDALCIGPKLQQDITKIILNWRMNKYVFCADVEKMFRQILIHPEDKKYQNILWRDNQNEPIKGYELQTVTYGTACAPYLSMRVIQQLVTDEGSKYPQAVETLRNSVYVDDLLFGADNEPDLIEKKIQINSLMKLGGFNLRKWVSNKPELLNNESSNENIDNYKLEFQDDETLKLLGIYWIPINDEFKIKINAVDNNADTKRKLLSEVGKLFDPLGWLSPVIIIAKCLLQSLWLQKLDWDDKLPPNKINEWKKFSGNLLELENVKIPRWINYSENCKTFEIHGFSDASEKAYSAVIYSRIIDADGKINVRILMAKSKVAPIKTQSIPRLELCGATLLTKLIKHVLNAINKDQIDVYCWSDSKIVLAWLKKQPYNWKVFVANRVSYIQSTLEIAKWNYVKSSDNPADLNSRGEYSPEFIDNPLWFSGPAWLSLDKENWPAIDIESNEIKDESRQVLSNLATAESWNELMEKYSSWAKLLRVTAYIFKFCNLARKLNSENKNKYLTVQEINNAREFWIIKIQNESFEQELKLLRNDKMVQKDSKLFNLNPVVDEKGILRVGGRIGKTNLNRIDPHPIILPRNHLLSTLIIRQIHDNLLHGGIQLTLRILRERYWVLNARDKVRETIHNCVTCERERARTSIQLMGELPTQRCSPSRPFTNTGIDYAGPIAVREVGGRGKHTHKAYIALFVCFSTRAIHLELVHDYSTQALLGALDRFCARRGVPQTIMSDNAKNFQGANNELKKVFFNAIKNTDFKNKMATSEIEWKFIPPYSPNQGGLWEAGVKSVKYHLKRVLKNMTPTIEEINTLLCKIEACVNSRPIAPLDDNIENIDALTPGHFLTGAALKSIPHKNLLDSNASYLNKWQNIQRAQQMFWRQWSNDYLNSLQKRNKWRQKSFELKKGDMVLLKDDFLPPCKWQLGIIMDELKGQDNLTRIFKLKTASGDTTRHLTKICKLPLESNNQK